MPSLKFEDKARCLSKSGVPEMCFIRLGSDFDKVFTISFYLKIALHFRARSFSQLAILPTFINLL